MKVSRRYTSFSYARYTCTDGRIIIVDEPLTSEVRDKLESLETADGKELIFLEDRELARELEVLLADIVERKREEDTLFVFPGNGANYPRQFSNVCQQFPATSVYSKRFWKPGNDPIVLVGSILPCIFLVTAVKTVVVVDDVISSGLTLRKLYQNNAWRFPQAEWIGAAWVSQIPCMKAKSGVNGYERIAASCVVGKPAGGRVPINSLSTLRKQPDIAENYALRHFKDPDVFLHLVNQ